jgi:hypothetical protein
MMGRCSGGVPRGLWRALQARSGVEVGSWWEVGVVSTQRRLGNRAGWGSRKSCQDLTWRPERRSTRWLRMEKCRKVMSGGACVRRMVACAIAGSLHVAGRRPRC